MNASFRRIVASGSAAVALLGGAAAVTVTASQPAVAVESGTVIERAVTAPVTMPDGRTFRITGMGGYGHQASVEHITTVASFAADEEPGTDVDGGLSVNGQGKVVTPQTTADYQQQMQTQAGGGTAIGVGVVAILILGIVVVFRVKHSHLKVGDAVVVALLGVALSGTVIGAMATQITNSGVGSLGGVLGGL
jgi:hypothetical protein